MKPVIELRDIHKEFSLPSGGTLEVLGSINLSVMPGEVIAIMGRSGSGKSTLLHILGLLERPTAGAYVLDGRDTTRLTDAEAAALRGATIGFIFQQFHLLERRTALENVAEPLLYASGRAYLQRKTRAAELLARVGLADRTQAMPSSLSGGEQQRVAIARALIRQPRLILADEPTGALDARTGEMVLAMLFDLVRSSGVTLVLVTHDPAIAERADRVLTLAHGSLEEARA
ncbi:MAG: ABC transporter ATP-binding protein [Chloroflexota bacterium]